MTTEKEREDDEGKAFVIPAHAGIRWRVVIRHVRAGEHPLEECKQILAFARMTKEGSEDDDGERARG